MKSRHGVFIGTVAIALVAAWASYRHMVMLSLSHGQTADIAYLLPLSVDGLMLVASIYMVIERATGHIRPIVRVSFLLGIVVSVAANWLAAPNGDLTGQCISAWSPIAFLLLIHMVATFTRRTPAPAAPAAPVPPIPHPDITPDPDVAPDDVSEITGGELPEAPVSPGQPGILGAFIPRAPEDMRPIDWVNAAEELRARYGVSYEKAAMMLGLSPRQLYDYRKQVAP